MINGIQHIGIGVRNRDRIHDFFRNALGFAVPISKHSGNCKGVIPLIQEDETRDVAISLNPYGGALVEIFQYTSRAPTPVPKDVDFSYNGFLFFGLKVKNCMRSVEIVEGHGGVRVNPPAPYTPMAAHGWRTVMFRDPEGTIGMMLEYPGSNVGYGGRRPRIGGIEYVAVGVSDLDASVDFYSRVLGYERIIYRTEGTFPEWDCVFGKGRFMKRALIGRPARAGGTFRHFLRGGMIELIQVEGNSGKHNFDGRKWGDIGVMEVCFDVTDIERTMQEIESKGIDVVAPPHRQDMGMNTNAVFSYIRDPDGSLLEFADISSLPVPYIMIRLFVNPLCVGIAKKFNLL